MGLQHEAYLLDLGCRCSTLSVTLLQRAGPVQARCQLHMGSSLVPTCLLPHQ